MPSVTGHEKVAGAVLISCPCRPTSSKVQDADHVDHLRSRFPHAAAIGGAVLRGVPANSSARNGRLQETGASRLKSSPIPPHSAG